MPKFYFSGWAKAVGGLSKAWAKSRQLSTASTASPSKTVNSSTARASLDTAFAQPLAVFTQPPMGVAAGFYSFSTSPTRTNTYFIEGLVA